MIGLYFVRLCPRFPVIRILSSYELGRMLGRLLIEVMNVFFNIAFVGAILVIILVATLSYMKGKIHTLLMIPA